MKVPLTDLRAQHREIEGEIRLALDRVLERQRFILGEEVAAFETELAAFTGAAHAIGVSSGTDAILGSLMALGIGPGDEVITTPFTFTSTVESIVRLGARPRYVDLEPGTFAPSAASLEAATTPRTRAILFVHLYGGCVDLANLARFARDRGIALVEDAAQGIGARFGGRSAGTFGALGALSFFPTKTLGAYGDAGAILTDDAALAARLRALRNHGQETKYAARFVGGNFRLDEMQAAVLRVKLRHLPSWLERRRAHAATLSHALRRLAPELRLPDVRAGEEHGFHQFVVRTDRRDALRAYLAARGVDSEVYYPAPMHRQEAWLDATDMPEADRATQEVLALPVHPHLTALQLETVSEACGDFFRSPS